MPGEQGVLGTSPREARARVCHQDGGGRRLCRLLLVDMPIEERSERLHLLLQSHAEAAARTLRPCALCQKLLKVAQLAWARRHAHDPTLLLNSVERGVASSAAGAFC